MNKLYYGDNLDVLLRFVREETVDLRAQRSRADDAKIGLSFNE